MLESMVLVGVVIIVTVLGIISGAECDRLIVIGRDGLRELRGRFGLNLWW